MSHREKRRRAEERRLSYETTLNNAIKAKEDSQLKLSQKEQFCTNIQETNNGMQNEIESLKQVCFAVFKLIFITKKNNFFLFLISYTTSLS